jgi:hypothetical protein
VIEEVAGAVKDLIKAGRVRQFGMSEAARGPFASRRSAAGHLTNRPMVMSTPQPRRRQLDGVSGLVRLARSGADRVFGTGAGCRGGSDSVRCVLLVVR